MYMFTHMHTHLVGVPQILDQRIGSLGASNEGKDVDQACLHDGGHSLTSSTGDEVDDSGGEALLEDLHGGDV